MKKRILSIALALCMVLAVLPTATIVQAATPTGTKLTQSNIGSYTTLDGGSYYLGEDITVSSTITVYGDEVTLDLNGHTLSGANGSDGISNGSGGGTNGGDGCTPIALGDCCYLTVTGTGTIIGGAGGIGGEGKGFGGGNGGNGANAVTLGCDSRIDLFGGKIIGGNGGNCEFGNLNAGSGGNGGNGVASLADNGIVMIHGGEIIGGNGGNGGNSKVSSGNGGNGGYGISIEHKSVNILHKVGTVTGGSGGSAGDCYSNNGTWGGNGIDREAIGYSGTDGFARVSSADMLNAVVNAGMPNIGLLADIDIDSTLTVTGKMELDLNGFVLKMTAENRSVIRVESSGDLTLTDSNPTATHKFRTIGTTWLLDETDGTETVTGGVITGARFCNGCVVIRRDGVFTMNGGNIAGNDGYDGVGVYNNGGTFTMNGGSIVGNCGYGVCNRASVEVNGTDTTVWKATFTMNDGKIVNNYGDSLSQCLGIKNDNAMRNDQEGAVIYANGGVVDGKVVNCSGVIDCQNGTGTFFAGEVENADVGDHVYGIIDGGIYLNEVLQAKDQVYDSSKPFFISFITGGVFYGEIVADTHDVWAGGIFTGGVFLGTALDNESFTVTGDRHAITVHLGENVKMYNKELASTLNGTVVGDTLYYLGNPTRACHKFDGWYTDAGCTIPVDFTQTVTEDITVYAKWIFTGHDFTAEIKSDDTLVSDATCKDEAVYYYTCSRCGEIEKSDTHTFEGDLDSNAHTGILSDWQMDNGKHWKVYTCCTDVVEAESTHNYVNGKCECGAVNYNITFDANGGSVDTASATTDIWGKLSSLPTPTRSADYRFDGWYTARDGGREISVNTVFEANTTVYPKLPTNLSHTAIDFG